MQGRTFADRLKGRGDVNLCTILGVVSQSSNASCTAVGQFYGRSTLSEWTKGSGLEVRSLMLPLSLVVT
jgi:hypothetical protein